MRSKEISLLCLVTIFVISISFIQADPVPYEYVSFDGDTYTLYPYVSEHIALLVPSANLDEETLYKIVQALDSGYEYYSNATGRHPSPFFTYQGRGTIAVVPTNQFNCGGAACRYLGATGIEILPPYFDTLYYGVLEEDVYDQVLFYEPGRNFWFYKQLEYVNPDPPWAVITEYAVFMRFMAMDAAGVEPDTFNGVDYEYFKSQVKILYGLYIADSSLSWDNTLKIDKGPANPMGLGSADLFASFMFQLTNTYGDAFAGRFWKTVGTRLHPETTQDAVDNFIVTASIAADEDLRSLFVNTWRWPLSAEAEQEIEHYFESETPTATSTPDEPTPTSTPQSDLELLVNGCFENKDVSGNPTIDPWKFKNKSGDKVTCNKDTNGDGTSDKFVARTGNCAFKFKGVAGENAKLQQSVNLNGLQFNSGDLLQLTVYINAKSTATSGKISVTVKYLDNSLSPDKKSLPLQESLAIKSSNLQKINITIKHLTETDKLFVDDVTLSYTGSTNGVKLIALP